MLGPYGRSVKLTPYGRSVKLTSCLVRDKHPIVIIVVIMYVRCLTPAWIVHTLIPLLGLASLTSAWLQWVLSRGQSPSGKAGINTILAGLTTDLSFYAHLAIIDLCVHGPATLGRGSRHHDNRCLDLGVQGSDLGVELQHLLKHCGLLLLYHKAVRAGSQPAPFSEVPLPQIVDSAINNNNIRLVTLLLYIQPFE